MSKQIKAIPRHLLCPIYEAYSLLDWVPAAGSLCSLCSVHIQFPESHACLTNLSLCSTGSQSLAIW